MNSLSMNKFKLFIENFLVYGLGGIISKIIPLIMLPLVTRLMPGTEYFGVSDLSNTISSFGTSLAVMGMYDAMYRMFFEKDDEEFKKSICSTALLFTLGTSLLIFIIMIIFKDSMAQYFLGSKSYINIVYLSAMATLVGATNSIISAPTRMQNLRKVFLVTNTISPMLSYGISIPLLLNGHYLIALPLAGVISSLSMEIIFYILNRKWFSFKLFDKDLLRQMLSIAIPLVPNMVIYWIFGSSDKLMITNMISVAAAGVYSVGSKLGHMSQLIYTAFAGGWQYFSFYTMNDDNQVESNSKIFEYLGIISFISTSFVCALCWPIFKILFTEEYLSGYIVAPYLFLAPLLLMLYQVGCNQFIIIKKTWPNMLILSIGAVLNLALNYILIPIIGIEGAAIATLVGYIVSDIIGVIVLCKMKLMILSKKFTMATLLMFAYMICWRLLFPSNYIIGTIIAIVVSIIWILLYKDDIMGFINKIKYRKD